MIDNNIAVSENASTLGRPFTPEELREWKKPKTWFRRTLVERSEEEFRKNPQLGLRLTLILEEAQIAALNYEQRKITEKQYLERMSELRKDVGNLCYR